MNGGYMYTTTVKTRKILDGKTGLKIAAPIFIWVIAELAFFLIAVKVEAFVMSLFAMLLFVIIFLAVIPIAFHMHKRAAEFRGKESFQYEEITFHIADGELYDDDIKLDVTYDESKTKIIVDHIIATYERKDGIETKCADFIGIVEEPYLEGFVRFLEEEGVTIHQEQRA